MQPDNMGVMVLEFQQPVYPGFQVSACSAVAQQVVYGHLSISDKNDAVIPEEIFQNPLCLHSVGQGQRRVLIDQISRPVVKIEDFQIFEMSRLADRLEQHTAQPLIWLHGSAGVDQ